MYEPLLDFGAELLSLVVYAVGAAALTVLGVAAEYNGVQQLLGGDRLLAAWYAYVGLVALAFATALARRKLLPRVAGSA